MIVDSSALLAVVSDEPERSAFVEAMLTSKCQASAATIAEAGIVADRRSTQLGRELDALLAELEVETAPVTPRQATLARTAYRRYGRGSGSPAQLNFGDCLTYALAAESGEELLFKGDDFGHTDLLLAAASTSRGAAST